MPRKTPRNTFWRGSVLWGRVKVKGRDFKWSLRTGDPAIAAARVAAERERQVAAAWYGDDRKRVDDAIMSWAQHHIAHQVAPSTAKRYAVSLAQLKPHIGGLYLDEIDKALITVIVDSRRVSGATTATIRRDLTALSSVLEYAIDQDWREEGDNPALARLKRLKERRDPIVLPEPADIEAVAQRAPGCFAAMIRAARVTGCRLDELVTAERTRLDHARRQLTVIGKGNKLRVVGLDFGDGYELLRAIPPRLGCQWLFWHHDGAPYRNASSRFAAIVAGEQKAAQREGRSFRPFTFHHLRHRHAVDWLKSGRSIYDLQQRLGHASIKTTEIYLQFLTPEEKRVAMAAGPQNGEQCTGLETNSGAASDGQR